MKLARGMFARSLAKGRPMRLSNSKSLSYYYLVPVFIRIFQTLPWVQSMVCGSVDQMFAYLLWRYFLQEANLGGSKKVSHDDLRSAMLIKGQGSSSTALIASTGHGMHSSTSSTQPHHGHTNVTHAHGTSYGNRDDWIQRALSPHPLSQMHHSSDHDEDFTDGYTSGSRLANTSSGELPLSQWSVSQCVTLCVIYSCSDLSEVIRKALVNAGDLVNEFI